jgi:hypothetical protein
MNDLVAMTQRDLGKPKFTEIATDLQEHTALRRLIRQKSTDFQSGVGVQWDVMVNHAQSAANVGLGASDNVNIVDTMVQAQADWRNSTCNYGFIGQEMDMNREPARIVDLVKQRRHAAMIAMAELMEANFWGPPVAASDTTTPWGVNTWIVKNASEGFNGTVPSGYTTIGLNPTTYPRWCNYTAQYTAKTKDDLIRKWRKAATFTHFKPPVDGMSTFNASPRHGFYTNYAVVGALEEALEAQNENLGSDVASQDGKPLFRRTPVEWIPKLEADTTDPVYGIDWSAFMTIILKGWWLKETSVPVYPGQHTVSATFLDCTYQFVARNRRCHFVLATGTTYPN